MRLQSKPTNARKLPRKAKFGRFFLPAIVVLVSLVLPLVPLEIVLQTTNLLAELDSDKPVYTPLRLVEADRVIDKRHYARAKTHRFGFNDVDRPPEKGAGVFRLAVVGDSFVFGDGLANEDDRWSRKLETIITKTFDNVEVLHWGQDGWSTKRQLEFLKENAADYHLDAILFGWVANDPDLGDIPQPYSNSGKVFKWIGLSFVLPESSKWLSDHIDALINTHFDIGYQTWEKKLYTQENLTRYLAVLAELAAFLDGHKIPFLFVLTPDNGGKQFDRVYPLVIPLFETVGAPYLNLLPAVREELGRKELRIYRANPADGHPGPRVTAIYARETAEYLSKACASEDGRLLSCEFAHSE